MKRSNQGMESPQGGIAVSEGGVRRITSLRRNSVILVVALCLSLICSHGASLVSRGDYQLGENWHGYEVMGRQFHTLLAWGYADSGELPLYRECGVSCRNYYGNAIFTDAVQGDGTVLPEEKITRAYKLSDMFWKRPDENLSAWLCSDRKLDCPLFVNPPNVRPPFYLSGDYSPDVEDYQKWKRAHPNFMGFRIFGEIDSDMRWFASNWPAFGMATRKLMKGIRPPRDQYAWGPLLEELVKREKALLFGEENFWTMHSGSYIGHLMAKYGAAGFFYEATGQGASRWQVATAFSRGASRQYAIPFGWYAANWYSGFTRDGQRTEGENNPRGSSYKYNGKDMGLSRSIMNRQNWYAWLNGATFLEHENWVWLHFDGTAEKKIPSAYARDLDDLNRLSKTLERGQVYAPIALLTPIFEQYDFLNGRDWMAYGDLCGQNAFFHTLVPVNCDVMQRQLRRKGFQCGFFNTSFGDCFDVICPDAGQKPTDFARAINGYKCAFLIGGYKREMLDADGLQQYVRNGGTLFISAEYIRQGLFPETFTGVAPLDGAVPAGTAVIDENGVKIQLKDAYRWEKMAAKGAQVLFKDEKGTPAAYRNRVGKGAVITIACAKMMPESFDVPCASNEQVERIVAGHQTFPLIRYLLERVQRECMPVQVSGDIHFGVNKTRKGWLVWLFNNNGVIKYTYESEEFDLTKTATVALRMSDGKQWRVTDALTGQALDASRIAVKPGAIQLVTVEKMR